jgi:hypothetical protein
MRAWAPEAPGSRKMPGVETAGEIVVPHRDAGAGRVNEPTLSRINTDVIDAALADAKEHEVTGRELRGRDRLGGALLFPRGARNREPDALVHVQREAAAVEAGTIRAAELIRPADERRRLRGDRSALHGARRLTRRARTATESRNCGEQGREQRRPGAHAEE